MAIIGEITYGPTNKEEASVRFRGSIYVVEDIKKGNVFTANNLRVIRPGDGLPQNIMIFFLDKKASLRY